MKYVERILERLKEKEIIDEKFRQVDTRILSTLNLKDFFEHLLSYIIAGFDIPYVWLTVIEESRLAPLVNRIHDSLTVRARVGFVPEADFFRLVEDPESPLPVSENMDFFSGFFPENGIYPVKSMTVCPVRIDGQIVGSINFGNISGSRFGKDMGKLPLTHMMLKISLCLSNVCAHEELGHLCRHDPVTGWLHRQHFQAVLEAEFNRALRANAGLSLAFAELKSFKQIIENYSHEAGERALRYVAETVSGVIRNEDHVGRLSGDEFAILFPQTESFQAERLLQRVQQHLDMHPLQINDHMLHISITFAVASTGDCNVNAPADLLEKASGSRGPNAEERSRQRALQTA